MLTYLEVKDEYPSPSGSPAPQARSPQAATPPQMPPLSNGADPAQAQAQEEFLRSMLRAQEPQPGQDPQAEDPMMKMLNQMLGGADGSDPTNPGGLPFSPDDISKATGLPPFLTNMFMGGQKAPPTPAQEQSARIWTIVHVIFSLLAGIYVVHTITSSTLLFGASPPAPATIQNPFLIFVMGELLVHGARTLLGGQGMPEGIGAWWLILKGISRDGSIVVFMMGAAAWWNGSRIGT